MSAPTLYELGDELEAIYAEIEASEGVLTPELETRLSTVAGDFDTKVGRVRLMCLSYAAHHTATEIERKRLERRAKALEKAEDSLRRYLLRELQRVGRENVRGPLGSVRVQDSPPAVKSALSALDLEALHQINPALVRVKPEEYSLDSRAVLEAHNRGDALPLGVTVERGKHIRFY